MQGQGCDIFETLWPIDHSNPACDILPQFCESFSLVIIADAW